MRMQTQRTGFTLIELLVVIAIIGVLAALTVSATMRLMGSQQETNTQTAMLHVDRALQQAWAKVVNDAKNEDITNATNVLTLAGSDPRRARVIWIKLRLMEAFPVTYAECNVANNPLYTLNLIPSTMRKNISSYQRTLNNAAVHPNYPNSESSACLLMALSINRGGGAFLNKDILGGNISDTDGDGVKEIIDGWGTPVFFYRFPAPTQTLQWTAQVQQVNPALSNYSLGIYSGAPAFITPPSSPTFGRGAVFADPLDTEGALMDSNWFGNAAQFQGTGLTLRQFFEQLCHPIVSPVPIVIPGATPQVKYPAFYITPVIASAGNNGKYASPAGVSSTTALMGLGLTGNLTAANQQASPTVAPTYGSPTSMSVDASNVNKISNIPDDVNDNIYSFQLRSGGTGN
jgi:prepilin-type N-terminal cleavage/methylation domain-containing protein